MPIKRKDENNFVGIEDVLNEVSIEDVRCVTSDFGHEELLEWGTLFANGSHYQVTLIVLIVGQWFTRTCFPDS